MQPSCAVIIGVEQYWRDDACLLGPAEDAVKMAKWCRDHGGVDPGQLRVLVSELEPTEELQRLDAVEATQDAIVLAVRQIRAWAKEGVRRAYFYFSGHGMLDVSHPAGPMLLPADFSPELRHKAVSLRAITTYLRLSGVPEQVVIADACQNFPYAGELSVQPNEHLFGVDIQLLPNGEPSPYQIVYASATPGGAARTVPGPKGRESAFTSELLVALENPGPAMRWDMCKGRYVVRADGLLHHIDAHIRSRVEADPEYDPKLPPMNLYYRSIGPPTNGAPVLRSFSPEEVMSVPLDITLTPEAVEHAGPEVGLSRDAISEIECKIPAVDANGELKACFLVRPHTYQANARAKRYRQEGRLVWDVYQPRAESITLLPDVPPAETPEQGAVARG